MTERKRLSPPEADAVFEGGGVKAVALVGAILEAEDRGVRWQNLAGTSGGAVVAALLAAGYRGAELLAELERLDLRSLQDRPRPLGLPLLGEAAGLLRSFGLYRGDAFLERMRALLADRGVRTFRQLRLAGAADQRYRYRVRVITADVSARRLVVLPDGIAAYGYDPDGLEVALAVRMSMGIPFFFEPVWLRNRRTGAVHALVDGGILSNFPVWLFDVQGVPRWPTFGFLLDEGAGVTPRFRHLLHYARALWNTATTAHDAMAIEESLDEGAALELARHTRARTIAIRTLGVGTTEFDLTPERKQALLMEGRRAAAEFFDRFDFQAYVRRFRTPAADVDTPGADPYTSPL
ncbi:MAG TPA: patatin-like phospholipase family protein [Dehalococcoidia bacterium]